MRTISWNSSMISATRRLLEAASSAGSWSRRSSVASIACGRWPRLKLLPGSPVDTPDPPINLALAPSGKFLYAATGTNGIEVLSVSSTGVLALVDQQASVTGNLSNLAISPNGKFLFAVDDDATVSAYTIDAVTGKLALIAGSPFAAGDQPSTIAVDPSGRFVLHADLGLDKIFIWKFDDQKGVLIPNEPPASQPRSRGFLRFGFSHSPPLGRIIG